jgi:hypothetical protein
MLDARDKKNTYFLCTCIKRIVAFTSPVMHTVVVRTPFSFGIASSLRLNICSANVERSFVQSIEGVVQECTGHQLTTYLPSHLPSLRKSRVALDKEPEFIDVRKSATIQESISALREEEQRKEGRWSRLTDSAIFLHQAFIN